MQWRSWGLYGSYFESRACARYRALCGRRFLHALEPRHNLGHFGLVLGLTVNFVTRASLRSTPGTCTGESPTSGQFRASSTTAVLYALIVVLSDVDIRNGYLVSCLESARSNETQLRCTVEGWPSRWIARVSELDMTGAISMLTS